MSCSNSQEALRYWVEELEAGPWGVLEPYPLCEKSRGRRCRDDPGLSIAKTFKSCVVESNGAPVSFTSPKTGRNRIKLAFIFSLTTKFNQRIQYITVTCTSCTYWFTYIESASDPWQMQCTSRLTQCKLKLQVNVPVSHLSKTIICL